MSLDIFKQNMLSYMQYQPGVKSNEAFAKYFTMQYDMLIRRSYQTINQVMIQKANTDLMEKMMVLAGQMALQKQSGLHDIINQYGKAIKMYWIGATLYQFPIPIMPAVGAYLNVFTTSAYVTNPGEFPDMKLQYPTDNSVPFIDMLAIAIQIHLLSVEGMYNTISLYPGFPVVPPAPGFVFWKGFTVQSGGGGAPATPPTPLPEVKVEPSVEQAIEMDAEQEQIANAATDAGHNMTASTSIGMTRTKTIPQVDDPKLGKHDVPNDVPPKEEPVATNKVADCDNVIVPVPPSSLILAMRKWGITQPLERAHFLAQTAHESGNFRYTREIWGPTAAQSKYDTHRWLGNEQPGDGRRYMGRGYIQLTGKANYKQFNKSVKDDVVMNPELVESKYVAETACWFWQTRKIGLLAKDDTEASILAVTKRINGGKNGYTDRKDKFCGYWTQIQENPNLYS